MAEVKTDGAVEAMEVGGVREALQDKVLTLDVDDPAQARDVLEVPDGAVGAAGNESRRRTSVEQQQWWGRRLLLVVFPLGHLGGFLQLGADLQHPGADQAARVEEDGDRQDRAFLDPALRHEPEVVDAVNHGSRGERKREVQQGVAVATGQKTTLRRSEMPLCRRNAASGPGSCQKGVPILLANSAQAVPAYI